MNEKPEGCHSIVFGTLSDAFVWAKDHGGWIAAPDAEFLLGLPMCFQWFDGCCWTNSQVIAATNHMGIRQIGTWAAFRKDRRLQQESE